MKESFVKYLLCPGCRNSNFILENKTEDDREVRDADLVCQSCKKVYAIKRGLIFLYDTLSPEVLYEREAYAKDNATRFTKDDREVRMMQLSRENAFSVLAKENDLKTKKILELGAANAWLSSYLAKSNDCVAMDMYYEKPNGLEAAEENMKTNNVFLERVVADMIDLPFINEAFDMVIICAALHHSSNLATTLNEIQRVLKDGGKLLLLNEPSNGMFGTNERAIIDNDMVEGFNEERYSILTWLRYVRQAGFQAKAYLPDNMSSVLSSRNHNFLAALWRSSFEKIKFIKSFLSLPILTVFDGFFNIVAIKATKR
ncbi:MAG: methyltransferase domain-containing protein [Candidatus Falkowbacteria bacterium]|nr:methyltransferase domain-containing protein [Candidatus Falkowbacteria bacterium]